MPLDGPLMKTIVVPVQNMNVACCQSIDADPAPKGAALLGMCADCCASPKVWQAARGHVRSARRDVRYRGMDDYASKRHRQRQNHDTGAFIMRSLRPGLHLSARPLSLAQSLPSLLARGSACPPRPVLFARL